MTIERSNTHSFDVALACKLGVEKAILIGNFQYWITENEKRKSVSHFQKGEYWTYDSAKGLAMKYPYFKEKSIARWIDELTETGWLKKDRFNKNNLDKTNWYGRGPALIEFILSPIPQNEESTNEQEAPIPQNEISIPQNDTSIPQNEECISQNEECIYKDTVIKLFIIKPIDKPLLNSLSVADRDDAIIRKHFQDQLNRKKKKKPPKLRESPPSPFGDELPALSNAWNLWCNYRKEKGKRDYKPIGLQGAATELMRLSGNDEQQAIAIINQSIAKSWDGFYPLKGNERATAINNPTYGTRPQRPTDAEFAESIDALAEWKYRRGSHSH